jgi:hypothetical protein
MPVKLAFCLAITCDGADIVSMAPSPVPGGTRLRVAYQGGEVTVGEDSAVPNLRGQVLSGSDWILVADDGVATFDARLTLGKSRNEVLPSSDTPAEHAYKLGVNGPLDDYLINARITGVADFGTNAASFDGKHPVALPVAFEGAGPSVTWAKPLFRQRSENYDHYAFLLRHQCIAIGHVHVADRKVTRVELKVFALGVSP